MCEFDNIFLFLLQETKHAKFQKWQQRLATTIQKDLLGLVFVVENGWQQTALIVSINQSINQIYLYSTSSYKSSSEYYRKQTNKQNIMKTFVKMC